MIELHQLIRFILDPTIGGTRPDKAGPCPWEPGHSWRVHLKLRYPAVQATALPLGTEVSAVWRYRVREPGPEPDTMKVEITAEGRNAPDLKFEATYRMPEAQLLAADQIVGARRIPIPCPELPRLPRTAYEIDEEIHQHIEVEGDLLGRD